MLKKIFLAALFLSFFLSINLYGQVYELWGMTTGGQGAGTIFKTDSIGENMKAMYYFQDKGSRPAKVRFSEASNGKLYSVMEGGKNGFGIIFEYEQYNYVAKTVFDFDSVYSGSNPVGGLLLAGNNKFYGMCKTGGQYGVGVIYEFDPITDSLIVVFDFDTISSGQLPNGGLVQGANGKLFGLTSRSCINNVITPGGTLFEYDINKDSFVVKLDFSTAASQSSNYAQQPMGDLLQASNGNLFGMTQYGGYANGGVIFEYDYVNDTLMIRHNFSGGAAYMHPTGTLTQLPNGMMYGFAKQSLFRYNPNTKQYQSLIILNNQYGIGDEPVDRLLRVPSGKLYGLCKKGGANGNGVLFEFDPNKTQCIVKVNFDSLQKGSYPMGGLFMASNGILYGMTNSGGANDLGVVYEYNYLNTEKFVKSYDFESDMGGNHPFGSLLLAANGKLYGMARDGGTYGKGVLFEFDPIRNKYTQKFNFNDTIGAKPYGSLIQASNGKLYGYTSEGGIYGSQSCFFEYNYLSDSVNIVYYLYNHRIYGDVLEVVPDIYLGISKYLGSFYQQDYGVLFFYDMNATPWPQMTWRYGFSSSNGRNPEGSYVKVSPVSNLALMNRGGTYNKGTILEYNYYTNTFALKGVFNGNNGARPTGNLLKTGKGAIYGLTSQGGQYNDGVLFQYTGSAIVKKLDFKNDSIGGTPYGTLMEASNGKLYGITYSGGSHNKGVLFEYNPQTSHYIVKHNFNGEFGANPYYTKLVEVDACAGAVHTSLNALVCNQYIAPSGKIITTSGIYTDTLSNRYFCDSIITINLIVSHVDTTITTQGATLTANFTGGTYQWLDCNNAYSPIQGANSQSFTPSVNGNYAVMIQGNGCVDTSACIAVNTVSIVGNSFESQVSIFPNPTSGKLYIEMGKKYKSLEVVIMNTIGKELVRKTYKAVETIELNINQEAGLYIIQLTNENGETIYAKILKK